MTLRSSPKLAASPRIFLRFADLCGVGRRGIRTAGVRWRSPRAPQVTMKSLLPLIGRPATGRWRGNTGVGRQLGRLGALVGRGWAILPLETGVVGGWHM